MEQEIDTTNLPMGRALIKYKDGSTKIHSVPILEGEYPSTFALEDGSTHFHAAGFQKGAIVYEECPHG